jgi:hypothetical protein
MLLPDLTDRRSDEPEPETSLAYLQSVYRDARLPIGTRMRAAIAAAPFEVPKLAVVATLRPSAGLGERLERAIKRSLQAGTYVPGTIEGEAVEVQQGPPVRLPVASPNGSGFKRRI